MAGNGFLRMLRQSWFARLNIRRLFTKLLFYKQVIVFSQDEITGTCTWGAISIYIRKKWMQNFTEVGTIWYLSVLIWRIFKKRKNTIFEKSTIIWNILKIHWIIVLIGRCSEEFIWRITIIRAKRAVCKVTGIVFHCR